MFYKTKCWQLAHLPKRSINLAVESNSLSLLTKEVTLSLNIFLYLLEYVS